MSKVSSNSKVNFLNVKFDDGYQIPAWAFRNSKKVLERGGGLYSGEKGSIYYSGDVNFDLV